MSLSLFIIFPRELRNYPLNIISYYLSPVAYITAIVVVYMFLFEFYIYFYMLYGVLIEYLHELTIH